jgi:hypothetical protein
MHLVQVCDEQCYSKIAHTSHIGWNSTHYFGVVDRPSPRCMHSGSRQKLVPVSIRDQAADGTNILAASQVCSGPRTEIPDSLGILIEEIKPNRSRANPGT